MDEIRAEVTRGTGCQHDGEMVWTSDDGSATPQKCPGGHVVVQGGKHRGDARREKAGLCPRGATSLLWAPFAPGSAECVDCHALRGSGC